MSSVEVLFHREFILALLGHGILAPSLIFGVFWLLDKLNNSAEGSYWAIQFNTWTTHHIWLPLARITAIISFIAMAYPVIYGIKDAPSVFTLLDSERINTLINTLFVVSILLPLVPILGRFHSLVLPIQSVAAAQLLFNWLNQHSYQHDISVLPSFTAFASITMLIIISHWVSKWISQSAGKLIDESLNVEGSTDLLFQSVLLFLQGPLLLIYTVELGRQLT